MRQRAAWPGAAQRQRVVVALLLSLLTRADNNTHWWPRAPSWCCRCRKWWCRGAFRPAGLALALARRRARFDPTGPTATRPRRDATRCEAELHARCPALLPTALLPDRPSARDASRVGLGTPPTARSASVPVASSSQGAARGQRLPEALYAAGRGGRRTLTHGHAHSAETASPHAESRGRVQTPASLRLGWAVHTK